MDELGASIPDPLPFWPKPVSIFGLSQFTTFISSSHVLTIPHHPSPEHLMLALAVSSHDFTATLVRVRDTFIEGFAPRQRLQRDGFPDDARFDGIPAAERRVTPCNIAVRLVILQS